VAITTFARRTAKVCYFILIIIGLGHLLPEPESYINYGIASQICVFLYGTVNADSMYDTFSNIDWFVILTTTATVYLLTIMLVRKTRRK
jgi:hypothetical protein